MSESDERKVLLVSKDNEKFLTYRKYMLFCGLFKDMLESESEDEEDDEIPLIPFPRLSSPVLKKIIEYCEHEWLKQRYSKHYLSMCLDGEFDVVTSEWEKKLIINVDLSMLMDLLRGANYINCKDFLDLILGKITSQLKYISRNTKKEFIDLLKGDVLYEFKYDRDRNNFEKMIGAVISQNEIDESDSKEKTDLLAMDMKKNFELNPSSFLQIKIVGNDVYFVHKLFLSYF